MKRLRTVLILLFSLVMSLCLFACGGDEEEQNGGAGTISSVKSVSGYSDLTDSDDEAARDAMLNGIKVTVSYKTEDGTEDVQLTYADCDVTGTISVHVVGEYTLTLKPKENNPDNRSRSITIKVNHNWGEKQGNAYTCAYCQARREVTTENVIIHYGAFHDGTQATNVPFDEKQVYTNKTEGASRIKEFGEVNGRVVPTLTAGQIEKGETITIRGTSRTTAALEKEDSPWGKVNEYWNSASLGIADRYNNENNSAHPGYAYGSSVIVRQEGWVLYNGIGETEATSTLAGIAGGFYDGTANNAGGWQNYGSHPDESKTASPKFGSSNYVHGVVPTDWNSVENWWVYSTGTGLNSGDYYNADEPVDVEYIWNYREDGVMEITYNYNYTKPSAMKYLKVYIKVPNSAVNFYDTIIHGDYNDLTITESEFITKNTPKEFTFNGLKSGAQSVYAENMAFGASTLDLKVEYLQKPGVQNDILLTNNQVYAYVGNMTRAELEATTGADELNSLSSEKWVSLASAKLNANTVAYKIHLSKGGQEYVKLLPENLFTVLENKVGDAVGADVTLDAVKALNNDKVGALSFSLASTTDKTNNAVVLTLGEGYAQPLTEDLKGKLANATDAMKYVALRINGVAGTKATFSAAEVTAKMNNTNVPCAVVLSEDGEDAYLVLALTGAGVVDVTGLQPTTVRLDLTALKGFKVTSAVESKIGALNVGGDVTVTYTLPANTANSSFGLVGSGISGVYSLANFVNNDSGLPRAISDTITLKKVERAEGTDTLKVTFSVGAAKLNDYQPFRVGLALDNTVEVIDYLDWNWEISTNETGYYDGNGYYAYTDANNTLKVVHLVKSTDLKEVQTGKFVMNINNGNFDNFKLHGLTEVQWRVDAAGNLVLVDTPSYVSGKISVRGTYGDSRDTDKGMILVFTIDVKGLGIESGDYYFNFAGELFDAQHKPESILQVHGTTITSVTLDETYTVTPAKTTDGSCFAEGLYAWEVKQGDTVLFYANAASAGGSHVDGDGDGVCDLCGNEIHALGIGASNWKWSNDSLYMKNVSVGDVYDFQATFKDSVTYLYGNVGIVAAFRADTHLYWMRTDGWMKRSVHDVWEDEELPTSEDETYMSENADKVSGDLWTDLPYNTLNGVVDLNGEAIDTVTTANFENWMKNKTVHIVARVLKDDEGQCYVDVEWSYYDEKMILVLNYHQGFKVQDVSTLSIGINYDTNCDLTKAQYVTIPVNSSVIKSAEGADVTVDETTYTGTNVEYTVGAFDSEGRAIVALEGAASKKDNNYYLAFKVNFDVALAQSTVLTLTKEDGTAFTGAHVELDETRKVMSVYVPVTEGVTKLYIGITNYEAYTLQNDIVVDYTNVTASDVTATVSEGDLTVGESQFTIAYTKAQATDKVVVGDVSKTLAELKSNDFVTLANGISAKAGDVTDGNVTVTFKKAAANLDAVIPAVEVRLMRGETLLALSTVNPIKIGASDGTKLESSDWYVKAVGTKLYLLTNATASSDDLPFNVNAGTATDAKLLGVYNLAYTVKDGVVTFNENNALTRLAKGIYSADEGNGKLVVIVLDLSTLGVEAATPYGYALEKTDFTKYYTVDASRTIAEQTVGTGEKETLLESTCVENGVEGLKASGNTFYYGLELLPMSGHNWQEKSGASADELHGYDKVYECGNDCGTLKYEQESTQSWGTGVNQAWGGNSWLTFAQVYKGGSYTVTGTNASAGNQIWNLPEPGVTDAKDTGADGYRIDYAQPFVQNDNTKLNLNSSTKATPAAEVDKTKLNNATITYTFDYSTGRELVITVKIVNGEYNYEQVITLTGDDMLDCYYLAFHADENVYTATSAETVVPAGKEVPAALSKHVHQYDSTTHRCPDDGALDPEHTVHTYDQNGGATCACGAVKLDHTHAYENGACKYCEKVQSDIADAGFTAVDDKSGAITGFNSRWYEVPVELGTDDGLSIGKKLIVVGSVTSAMAENSDGVNAELLAGYTMRADDWGWTFDPDLAASDDATAFGTVTKLTHVYDTAHELAEGTDIWATYKGFATSADWRVEIYYKSATEIVMTITVSGTELTLVSTHTLQIVNAAMIAKYTTIWVGGEDATNLTVNGYKLVEA